MSNMHLCDRLSGKYIELVIPMPDSSEQEDCDEWHCMTHTIKHSIVENSTKDLSSEIKRLEVKMDNQVE
jgi:5-bromo-4-chloroindolyl phosphate hydrolysis protein